jgi:hypothetical protein
MKQHKKVGRRKASTSAKPRRLAVRNRSSVPFIHEDEIMNRIEVIAKTLVNASDDNVMPDGVVNWENDEDWLEYLERGIERIEQRFSVINAITREDIQEIAKHLQEEYPEYGAFPVERYLERFITSLRSKFRKALYFARIERDADRLRIAVREEVYSLCTQGPIQAHDFIKLPPQLPEDNVPELSEKERAEIPEIYCRKIWWMMADDYPENCTTHFYLECPEGWFSAEVYASQEEAELEAESRRRRGEGDLAIREITEGDDWVVFTVLFSKQRPNFVG